MSKVKLMSGTLSFKTYMYLQKFSSKYCFSYIPKVLGWCFCFHLSQSILFPCDFPLNSLKSVLFNNYIFIQFPNSLLFSHFIPLWSENMLRMISIVLSLLQLVLYPILCSILENVLYVLKRSVYSTVVGWCVLKLSFGSGQFIVCLHFLHSCWSSVQLF